MSWRDYEEEFKEDYNNSITLNCKDLDDITWNYFLYTIKYKEREGRKYDHKRDYYMECANLLYIVNKNLPEKDKVNLDGRDLWCVENCDISEEIKKVEATPVLQKVIREEWI